jgi:hypothetical protein
LEKIKRWNGCQSLANRSLHLKKKRTVLEAMMKMIAKMQLALEICLQR